jgi:hypothetical protein
MPRRVDYDERDNGEPEDREPRGKGPRRTSALAIWSLILGLSSVCLCLFTGIPAMICGGLSVLNISNSKGRLGGMGMAIAGGLLGLFGTCGSTSLIGYLGYTKGYSAVDRTVANNNLKQIGLSMHAIHDATGAFPPAAADPRNRKPGLSWRVHILPYIEQNFLYQQFKLDEPWDSPNNRRLLDQMPPQYAAGRKRPGQTTTPFRVFVGGGAAFEKDRGIRMTEITDGTSNTILVVEATEEVPWTKPDELEYSPTAPLPKLGSPDRSDFLVLMADTSTRSLSKSIREATLRAAITRAGGELLGPDW